MRRNALRWFGGLAVSVVLGCSGGAEEPASESLDEAGSVGDPAVLDGGSEPDDASLDDAATLEDTSVPSPEDASSGDTGASDAAKVDGGATTDSGKADTGMTTVDSGKADTGVTTVDSGKVDSGADTGVKTDGGTTVAACSVTLSGATGKESGGMIPVCCAPSSADKTMIMDVFKLLNEHRAANGLAALVYDDKLEATIQGHCEHMRTHTFFSHTAPETSVSSPWTRAKLCGTSANAENIANGYTSASSVMAGWKASPGHNANMLGAYKRVGIGKAGGYWGQIFAN